MFSEKNETNENNKWKTYERYKKKLSCKYGWNSKENPNRYERAIKLLCMKMEL
jgi:hypothetical protein